MAKNPPGLTHGPISPNSGRAWPYRRNIAEGRHSFGYRVVTQTRNGLIHVIHTEDRTTIMHAVFPESAVTGEQ